ncbi:MAG: hypothetical protein AAB418_04235 [candidate division NC10 bacterium]
MGARSRWHSSLLSLSTGEQDPTKKRDILRDAIRALAPAARR